jgi:hypothetical protein
MDSQPLENAAPALHNGENRGEGEEGQPTPTRATTTPRRRVGLRQTRRNHRLQQAPTRIRRRRIWPNQMDITFAFAFPDPQGHHEFGVVDLLDMNQNVLALLGEFDVIEVRTE